MPEYISREKTAKVLREVADKSVGLYAVIVRSVANAIEEIPAADVRPVVRGKWVFNDPLAGDFMCDYCFERQLVCSRYCPNCGAEMKEES